VAVVVLDGIAGPHVPSADHTGEELDRAFGHGRTIAVTGG
jgi:hypothetical protein